MESLDNFQKDSLGKFKVKKDSHDNRDLSYDFDDTQPRTHVDLRPWCSPVEDQLHLGSCVAQAVVGAYELLINKKDPKQFKDLSRLFLYYNTRVLENFVNEDAGAYVRDGVKAANKWGICNETIWPYLIDKFKDLPSPESYLDAQGRIIKNYYRVDSHEDMILALDRGFPVVTGMQVFDGFDDLGHNGELEMPDPTANILGGHAVVVVGFDNFSKKFICRNSFGETWGDNGYFYMPYAYATEYLMDNWFFEIN